jgi:hypothetical protein
LLYSFFPVVLIVQLLSPRGQTLNEDNTLNLLVTPPLRKHFVGGWPLHPLFFLFVLVVKYPVHREINAPIEIKIEPDFALSEAKA